jgi:hypothetical protein
VNTQRLDSDEVVTVRDAGRNLDGVGA